MFLIKWYHATHRFLHFAKEHRIKLNPHEWYKGVLLLLLGWGLLAIDSVIFEGPFGSINTKINFVIQFSSALFFLVFVRCIYTLFKRKPFDVISFLKITPENEISGSAILSPQERKRLIRIRAIIGAIGYIGFQLAKIAIGAIDNSIIYGADGLMYAFIAMLLLKAKYNRREWVGIVLAFLGVAVLIRIDMLSGRHALLGGMLGICASFSLAIILILTSVIIQHDHPVRVAFYQCFWGFIISLCVLVFAWNDTITSDFSITYFKDAIIEGALYAAALICFFQAFYYVDPLIVAVSSYSLDIYVTALEGIINKEFISSRNTLSILLIAFGSAILIREEYKKEEQSE